VEVILQCIFGWELAADSIHKWGFSIFGVISLVGTECVLCEVETECSLKYT
jgi:hypothetical protein